MSDIEIKIEALRRCVSQDAYEKALAELQGGATPPVNESTPRRCDRSHLSGIA